MRIAGVTIPDTKRLEIALTALYGVGRLRALDILEQSSIDPGKKAKDLTTEEEAAITRAVEESGGPIEGDLRREVSANIKRLKDIGSYRGRRHARRLPARGQRTRTNARTLKGAKKTMGSGKRKVEKK